MVISRKEISSGGAELQVQQPRWEVSLSELKQALDTEIHFYQRQAELINEHQRQQRGSASGTSVPAVRSELLSPKDLARLHPVSLTRLRISESKFILARSKLGRVVDAINDYNDRQEQEGMLTSLWRFASNRREADELQQRRARALRQYHAAEKHLEGVLVWIKRHGLLQAGKGGYGDDNEDPLQQMHRDRQLGILKNFQKTELTLRKELRSDIAQLGDNEKLVLDNRNLDEVIVDLDVAAQIRRLRKNKNRA